MKKMLVLATLLFSVFFSCSVYATSENNTLLDEETTGKIIEIKEKEKKELQDFTQAYGSEAYGYTAYMLSKVRVYSIPLCFIGIAVGAIWQYVIGIRKLDVRDRGLLLIISFVTIFVICQVLPLIFAVVVKGFRS